MHTHEHMLIDVYTLAYMRVHAHTYVHLHKHAIQHTNKINYSFLYFWILILH